MGVKESFTKLLSVKNKASMLPVIMLASLAQSKYSFGAEASLEGICKGLGRVQNIAPTGVKFVAVIILIVLISVAVLTFIDREKGGGKMSIVIAVAGLAGFAILWSLSDSVGSLIGTLKSNIGC